MGTRAGLLALAAACPLLLAACTSETPGTTPTTTPFTTAPASAPTTSGPFKITTTIDDIGRLPHRITWIATPARPAAEISQVRFLIDDKLMWSEGGTPYTFGDDRGYLVTSFLAPGAHKFSVEADARDGTTARWDASREVVAPPEVPSALAGTWQRTVNTANAPVPPVDPGKQPIKAASGEYRIEFDKRWIKTTFPGTFNLAAGTGLVILTDWEARPTRLIAVGSVVTHRRDGSADFNPWCSLWGPGAAYDWSVTGDTLTLTPVGGTDQCTLRGFVWAGEWTRAD